MNIFIITSVSILAAAMMFRSNNRFFIYENYAFGNIFYGGNKQNIQLIKSAMGQEKFDMDGPRKLTEDMLDTHAKWYGSIVSYNAGNCWGNVNLSKGLIPTDNDMYADIKNALGMVPPLPNPVNLFHGFEKFLQYNDTNWNIGSAYYFPFCLSKTPSWKVAAAFANNNSWMFVKYPIGSKHLCVDVRMPYNDEFEYLACNETLKLTDIVYHISVLPPRRHKYYVFDAVIDDSGENNV